MTHTFEIARSVMHPDTRREVLQETMERVFDDECIAVRNFLDEQGTEAKFTSSVLYHDDMRDPICGLFVNIEDDTVAIYFKMWFERKCNSDKS